MQDRPTYDELLAAVEQFLDTEIVPNVAGSRGFHARVAANAIRIVRRELANEDEGLAAEWKGLDAILGVQEAPTTRQALREALRERNEALCALIRDGTGDKRTIFRHVKSVVLDKLKVSDPDLLKRS
jgi:uncharacterized membrane protein